ncbi:ubiquinone oxidoreductase 20 kd subunit [Trametes sanguinea]|nr:ubiquinone oxidoreductase 20 kd subunit [Trametes sanguinea]
MLARRALQGLARPLTRLSSSTPSSSATPVPTNEASSPSAVAPQAPNYPTTWSTSQRPRPQAQSGPRFEQTIMELQPNPLSAMEMISREPIRVVHGRKAVCDGGGGPLGHPKIYINLDKPGPRACGYCGLRFEQAPHHQH